MVPAATTGDVIPPATDTAFDTIVLFFYKCVSVICVCYLLHFALFSRLLPVLHYFYMIFLFFLLCLLSLQTCYIYNENTKTVFKEFRKDVRSLARFGSACAQVCLILQVTESLLQVLVQLVEIGLDLRLAVLHWVLRRSERWLRGANLRGKSHKSGIFSEIF